MADRKKGLFFGISEFMLQKTEKNLIISQTVLPCPHPPKPEADAAII
jgi:hypothetical protein